MPDLPTPTAAEAIRDKITRCLQVYGALSPSMLHTGIGPSIPASIWRPVLEQMIADGEVIQRQTIAHGRTYPVLSLRNQPDTQTPSLKTLRNKS